jgi:hypothetical protein
MAGEDLIHRGGPRTEQDTREAARVAAFLRHLTWVFYHLAGVMVLAAAGCALFDAHTQFRDIGWSALTIAFLGFAIVSAIGLPRFFRHQTTLPKFRLE